MNVLGLGILVAPLEKDEWLHRHKHCDHQQNAGTEPIAEFVMETEWRPYMLRYIMVTRYWSGMASGEHWYLHYTGDGFGTTPLS